MIEGFVRVYPNDPRIMLSLNVLLTGAHSEGKEKIRSAGATLDFGGVHSLQASYSSTYLWEYVLHEI